MMMNEIETTKADLQYDVMLLESELKGCEIRSLGEELFNKLVEAKIKLAIFLDTEEV